MTGVHHSTPPSQCDNATRERALQRRKGTRCPRVPLAALRARGTGIFRQAPSAQCVLSGTLGGHIDPLGVLAVYKLLFGEEWEPTIHVVNSRWRSTAMGQAMRTANCARATFA